MGALQQVVRPFFISLPQAEKPLSPIFIPNLQPTDLIQHTHAMKSTPRLNLNHVYNLLLVKSKYMYNGRLKSI